MKTYLGVDVGSVTTKLALLDDHGELITSTYLRTQGRPITMLQEGLKEIEKQMPPEAETCGIATTGSARYLAGVVLGADLVKNEITAHAVAAMHYVPGVQTVIEIGGQDSKVIIIRDNVVVDFSMNTVCAAGTGSFLEHQASRLNIDIGEFGRQALRSKMPVRIAGRCTVFAESDMIHKQQMGHKPEDIVYGLCQALVREELENNSDKTKFKGFEVSQTDFRVSSFICKACPNECEVAQLFVDGGILARWGGRCDRRERVIEK